MLVTIMGLKSLLLTGIDSLFQKCRANLSSRTDGSFRTRGWVYIQKTKKVPVPFLEQG
jgi:hypothetical protein